jgi:hypothetical protein
VLKFAIDWLAVTIKGNSDEKEMSETLTPINPLEFRPCRAFNGYTNAIENRAGAYASWNVNRGDMGVHIEYSGGALAIYRTHGIDPADMVARHVEKGHTVTRLDVAIDVIDTDIKPSALDAQLRTGKAHTKGGRKFKMWRDSEHGETLYIGSRTSNIFLRIYDKGAELGTDDVWVRVELELKAGKARQFANLIANDGSDSAIEKMRGVLRTVVEFPGKVWEGIVGDEDVKLTDSTKKRTDTKAWLLELVAPAMGKYIAKTGDATITEQFWEAVEFARKVADTWDDNPQTLSNFQEVVKVDKVNRTV